MVLEESSAWCMKNPLFGCQKNLQVDVVFVVERIWHLVLEESLS